MDITGVRTPSMSSFHPKNTIFFLLSFYLEVVLRDNLVGPRPIKVNLCLKIPLGPTCASFILMLTHLGHTYLVSRRNSPPVPLIQSQPAHKFVNFRNLTGTFFPAETQRKTSRNISGGQKVKSRAIKIRKYSAIPLSCSKVM